MNCVHLGAALAVLGLVGCSSSSAQDDPTTPGVVLLRQNGFAGDLTLRRDSLDLSVSEVEDSLRTDLLLAPQTQTCSLGVARGPRFAVVYDAATTGVYAFVIEDPAIRTPEGIAAGATLEEIRSAYGPDRMAVLDGVVSPTGGPLVVVDDLQLPGREPGPSTLHYGFDTDDAGRVTRLRAGFWPYVAYADYCSPAAATPGRTGWPLTRDGG